VTANRFSISRRSGEELSSFYPLGPASPRRPVSAVSLAMVPNRFEMDRFSGYRTDSEAKPLADFPLADGQQLADFRQLL
jgi:hypothetical protein